MKQFQCKRCHLNTSPHAGGGLCRNCYMKDYRRKQKLQPSYDDGLQEGIQIAVEAIDKLLMPHGGRCSFWGVTLAIELQGKTLKTNLEVE